MLASVKRGRAARPVTDRRYAARTCTDATQQRFGSRDPPQRDTLISLVSMLLKPSKLCTAQHSIALCHGAATQNDMLGYAALCCAMLPYDALLHALSRGL